MHGRGAGCEQDFIIVAVENQLFLTCHLSQKLHI
jgi:hypothetical protein